MKTVSDYMNKELISIDADKSVLDAITLMQERSVSSLLIMEENNTIGIFTERDILTKVNFKELAKLSSIKVKKVMTGNLKTAGIHDSYINIMESMQNNKIRHMPVADEGFIVGMISLRDLMNHYHENLERLLEETISALSSAVEKRDPYTAGHQQRVTQLACAIAKDLGLEGKQVSGLRMAAFIHDIGKLYIPAEILSKPGRLNEAEFNLIKMHPQIGYDILKGVEFPWPIADIVLQHHERLDGSGYPKGIKSKDILFEAKIIAVVDVVEAMMNHRPYRPALGMAKTMQEVLEHKNTLYDASVVDSCFGILNREKLFWGPYEDKGNISSPFIPK